MYLLAIVPVSSFAQEMFSPTKKPGVNVISGSEFLGSYISTLTWDVCTDLRGYTYMITEKKVERFDGIRLKDLVMKNAVHVDQFERFSKDAKGRLWVFSPKMVALIDGDSLELHPLPPQLFNEKEAEIESFYCDASGTFHLGIKEQGYFKLSANGDFVEVLGKSSGMHGFCASVLEDGKLFCFSIRQPEKTSPGIYYLEGYDPVLLKESEAPWPHLKLQLTYTIKPSLVKYSDGTLLFNVGDNQVFYLENKRFASVQVFQQRIVRLFVDSRDDLWIGTPDKGLFKIKENDFSSAQNYLPADMGAITDEDIDGRLWLHSGQVGFGCITHPKMLHYSGKNGFGFFERAYMVNATTHGVACMGPPRGIYVLGDTIRYEPLPQKQHTKGSLVYDVNPLFTYSHPDSTALWVGFYGEVARWNGTSWKRFGLDPNEFNNVEVWRLQPLADGTMLGATTDCIFTFKNGVFERISDFSEQRIFDITVDEAGSIWVARMNGLSKLENGGFTRPAFLNPTELVTPIHSVNFLYNALWIQLMGGGSFFCLKNENLEEVIDPAGDPLRLSNISITKSGDFWAMAEKNDRSHLCKIVLDGDAVEVSVYNIDEDAKKSLYHHSFLATDEAIYIGSAKGLFVADIADIDEEGAKTTTVLTELRINHQPAILQKEYNLEYHENYFNLAFDGINYNREPTEYRYKLAGLDSAWTLAEYQQVQYTNLDPGDYHFEVQARATKGMGYWSEPVAVDFEIAKPYWETWWFRISLILLITLLVTSFVMYRVRRVVAKGQIELEMSQLELRALKAQINPHFIFNAMSSATYYLTKNQPEDARRYLVKFSRLIRSVLENSDKSAVLLEEELDMIQQYVALESEKFEGGGIDFQVSMMDDQLGETEIPSALFQPYIENAIWHGLRPKEGRRVIKLNCYQEQEVLYIEIEDNGVGREAAKKVKKEDGHRRSFGMMIASRRIELLNNRKMASVKLEDLYDEKGVAAGTKVRFGIPVSINRRRPAEPVGFRA